MKILTYSIVLLVVLSFGLYLVKKDGAIEKFDSAQNTNITTSNYHWNIVSDIPTPHGFERVKSEPHTFQYFLQQLPLKPEGSLVKYYNGNTKRNDNIYVAVIDLEIGSKNLHQCADAIMRLRAEYLWKEKRYDEIGFNFTNGYHVEYSKWISGHRMHIQGNKTWWEKETEPSNTYEEFWNYLELIFMYAGTASLEKELHPKDIKEAEIGDILIQGGHPGHAVIIVDKAIDPISNQSAYMIAQSYMPAQETHILVNPSDHTLSPWYHLEQGIISTPEWNFRDADLMQF